MTIRLLLLLVAMLWPIAASAQWCEPKTIATPNAPGSRIVTAGGPLDAGIAFGMWCPSTCDAGVSCLRAYTWAGLWKHATPSALAAAAAVLSAPPAQAASAASAAMTSGAITPLPGGKDECLHSELRRMACVQLMTPPFAGAPVGNPDPARCGVQRNCSTVPEVPPAPVAWAVSRVGMAATATTRPAYPFANGIRGTTSTARATIGAPCDCTVSSVEGTSTYCAHDARKATVALCAKK